MSEADTYLTDREIKAEFASIIEESEKRDAINAGINASRKELRAAGLTTVNINEHLRILKSDNNDRAKEDDGRARLRRIYGFADQFAFEVAEAAE